MTPLGHAGISLLAGIGLTKIVPGIDTTTVLAGTVIGGTILDLDLIYEAVKKKSLDFLDKRIGSHRYLLTHTPFFVSILGLAIAVLINPHWAISFTVGAMLHLSLDTLFFPEGVNLTFPFGRKMTTILTIKTHQFWAPKRISQIDGWWKNYLSSPLFWVAEVLPSLLAFVLVWQMK